MPGLQSTIVNQANFVPTVTLQTVGKKWILKELILGEYLCTEHKHVALKFQPLGVLHIFGENKSPIIHRYSLQHNTSEDKWYMTVSPSLHNEPGTMLMEITKNYLTLSSPTGQEVIHLHKIKA